jgi:hypothetical protein
MTNPQHVPTVRQKANLNVFSNSDAHIGVLVMWLLS